MASKAHPVLPIYTGATASTRPPAVSTTESQPQSTLAVVSRVAESIRSGLSRRRPWTELVDRSAFARPESLSDAANRFRKNYSYFRVNYACVVALTVAFSLFNHPFSLFVLLFIVASWMFLYLFRPSDQPLVLFGRTFSERETLGGLILTSIFLIFLTSVGSVLISAVMVGVAAVCVHGAFRVTDDLFLEEQDPAAMGFLSLLGAGATPAYPARSVI
ncbi:PREDICTED: PRA1 family protein B5 [Tarenaya hassleriana]|uniref:PRA1 family protein B5 n=1 Tax=Tarenaya hassleriana TaxID=28532 RepID=UPI00053C7E60|nr:PREDICTED: PRA1 family protein B5 [Tarenaya hassleriana]